VYLTRNNGFHNLHPDIITFMRLIKTLLTVFFLSFLNGCFNFSGTEDFIKTQIAKDGDRRANKSDVSLYKNDYYYIGYRKGDVLGEYFIAFKPHDGMNFETCRIFSNGNWDKIDSINHLIIDAGKKINQFGLKLNTIYDDVDSVNIFLVDNKNFSDNSIYSIKNIYEIEQTGKYKLEKCFDGSGCPRF
jgi:hypothetical protein